MYHFTRLNLTYTRFSVLFFTAVVIFTACSTIHQPVDVEVP